MTPDEFTETATNIEHELGKIIVGQTDLLRSTLTALLAGGHVLLEGVPGLGKTALVRTIGQVLDLQFSRIQFTPDLMPADIVGTNIIEDGEHGRHFSFQAGPIFGNVILADEINRATPKTQSALLEAMQEGSVTVGTATRPLPKPFFVLATQNPIELEGTYPLPEAQLDRFLFKVLVPFPTNEELTQIALRTTGKVIARVETIAGAGTMLAMMELIREVPIAPHVLDYAVRLVSSTHPERTENSQVKNYVRFGASPRGVQALVLAGKVRALFEGRSNVAFDDLKSVALPALRHRVLCNFEADAVGITSDMLLADLMETVKPEPSA